MSSFLQRFGLKKSSIVVKYLLFKNTPELEDILKIQNKNLTPEQLDYLLKKYTYEYSGTNSIKNTNKLSRKMDPTVLNAITELATNSATRELFIKFIQKINGKNPISENEINFLNNPASYNMKNIAEEINRIQSYICDKIITDYNKGIINKEKFIDLCKSLRGGIDTIIVIKDNTIIYSYYDKNIDLLKKFSNAMIKSNESSNLYKLLPQNEQKLINAEKVLSQYKIFLSYDKTNENYKKYVEYLNNIKKVIANDSHLQELTIVSQEFKNKINLIKKSLEIKYNSLKDKNSVNNSRNAIINSVNNSRNAIINSVNNSRNAIINREGYLFEQNGGGNIGDLIQGIFYLLYIILALILCLYRTTRLYYYKSRKNKPENNAVINYNLLPGGPNKQNNGIGPHKGGNNNFYNCLISIVYA